MILGVKLEVQAVHATGDPIPNLQCIVDSISPSGVFTSHPFLKKLSVLFRVPLGNNPSAFSLSSGLTHDHGRERERG